MRRDHGAERELLQVRELRVDERVQLGPAHRLRLQIFRMPGGGEIIPPPFAV